MQRTLIALTFGVALASTLAGSALAASPFDGRWIVTQNCAESSDGAAAYAWTYGATVRNGILTAHRAAIGGGGSINLQGKIGQDGSAVLDARGVTGPPAYSVGRVAPGSPVRFHIRATFDANSGSGSRLELRPCDFTFSRNGQ